jgi:hypothetical protein
MKKLKLNSSGFSFLELCIGLFLLAALAGAGTYVAREAGSKNRADRR